MLLAEHLILIDCARRRTIPMDELCYGGSVLVVLLFWEGPGVRNSKELQIELFLLNIGFNFYVTHSIKVCMYVGNTYTKCVQPP
jgi:hypothetical protein